MPGRQAHGRPLLPTAPSEKPKSSRLSKRKATSNVLNAFAIAADQAPAGKRGARAQGSDHDANERRPKRRKIQDDGDEDSDGAESAGRPDSRAQKRARKDDYSGDEIDDFSGSDSDGNEWHEGVGSDDDDEDIDSDAAFGESDDERFEGFAFRGSNSKGQADDSDAEDSESLGSDAIDLAQALDQVSDDESSDGENDSASDSEDGSSITGSDTDEDDEDDDPSKLATLQSLVTGFGGENDDGETTEVSTSNSKPKLSLDDLSLSSLKDPQMNKSLKLMHKEEKASKPGASKKLDIPLPRRQQDRLLRSAAYEKASDTLDRWTETVKQNRRAEHLVFPLAQNAHDAGLYNEEILPLTQKKSTTELESTILSIMEESGLGPSSKTKKEDDAGNGDVEKQISQGETKDMDRERRRARQAHDREQIRAKRIKKIKSKAWRKIHRKERLRDEELEREEINSDEEREANDLRRAMERMGARHRESKWAKLGKKAGRAVWDDDFRSGLTDMARKRDELRRRVEGRDEVSDKDGQGDSESDAGSEGLNDRRKLLQQLDKAAAYDDDDEPEAKLMKMKFMQRAETARKKENDDMVRQLRRELDSDLDDEQSEDFDTEIGRRQYGTNPEVVPSAKKAPQLAQGRSGEGLKSAQMATRESGKVRPLSVPNAELEPSAPGAGGAWARAGNSARKSKKTGQVKAMELNATDATPSRRSAVQLKAAQEADDGDSEVEDSLHLPMAVQDQEMLNRAFAGADVVGDFVQEKTAAEESEGEKEIDNTLPGWGSWVGDGVSNREKKRHKGRFVTKVDGIKKADRKDAKLEKVIISERRVKKNDAYLASQLPHPFESRQQYERSLRLPIGPEWMTKESFQESTKPRVILKQGIIAPMSKPMY